MPHNCHWGAAIVVNTGRHALVLVRCRSAGTLALAPGEDALAQHGRRRFRLRLGDRVSRHREVLEIPQELAV